MYILGIETSCDDTSISLISAELINSFFKVKILSDVVSSQVKLHQKYGGVYPFLARREHQKNLPLVFEKVLKEANFKSLSKIALIGVTVGPGLEPCLWQGINFAKKLAKKWNIPLLPVNHIEAHFLVNLMNKKIEPLRLFPAVSLVVSGGHTELILIENIGKYKLLGETRDDAAGECFDKTARILGLGYPGGPEINKEAKKFKTSEFNISLPRPMIHQKNYDFSFAGLKTAVLYETRKRKVPQKKSKKYIQEMAKEIQQAILDVLIFKTLRAIKEFRAKSLFLGGGVTANDELRRQLKEKIKEEKKDIRLFIPKKKFCTDNATMVAVVGFFHQKKATTQFEKIRAIPQLKITQT